MANHNNTPGTKTPETLDQWIGLDVYGASGEEIGEIDDIYIDDATNRPQWLTIKGGWFGMNRHFTPIEGAEYRSGDIHLPYTKDQIKDAPSLDADNDHLEPGEETKLYTHYKIDRPSADTAKATPGENEPANTAKKAEATTTSGDTEASVVRSEEQLNVDTNTKAAGTVTLRKYVVTEDVDLTVPVRKEVAKVVREPVDPDAPAGGPITDADSEETIVLREEEIIVDKEVVAKERVSVETDIETEQEHITDTVRKERVSVDGDVSDRNR